MKLVSFFLVLFLLTGWAGAQEPFWKLAPEPKAEPDLKFFLPAAKARSGQAQLVYAKFPAAKERLTVRVVLGEFFRELQDYKLLGRKTVGSPEQEAELVSFSANLGKKPLMGRLLFRRDGGQIETFLLVTLKDTHSKFLKPFTALQTKVLEGGLTVGDVL